MTHGSYYLGKLYNDLIINSPDVILSMEGVVETGKICGLPSDELEKEMDTLEMAYQRLNILLERELKAITLSEIIGNLC